jgi:hypothetical protein
VNLDAVAVSTYVLTDPNNITDGLVFDAQGNNDSVQEWSFIWDANSFVYNVMAGHGDTGTTFIKTRAGLTGGAPCLLDLQYHVHQSEELAHASVCYIDDSFTADAVLWCAKTTLASGDYVDPSYFDWIEITLIIPSGQVPVGIF